MPDPRVAASRYTRVCISHPCARAPPLQRGKTERFPAISTQRSEMEQDMDLEISTQHIVVHPRCRQMIDRQLTKLNGKGATLLRVHVTLVHSRHHTRGNEEVRVLATTPGRVLRVQKSRANIGDAIRAAFVALGKEIEADTAHRRSPERSYGPHFIGTISQLFGDRGYGFIRTTEDQEVYFHRDSLHNLAFTELREGQEVQFDVEQGDKGPQAARVYPSTE